MDLFEFIMNNFIFFLVLLWIVSSLFGKRGQAENEQPRPVRRHPQEQPTWEKMEGWEQEKPWEKANELQEKVSDQPGQETLAIELEKQPGRVGGERSPREAIYKQIGLTEKQRRAKEMDLTDAKVAANEIGSMGEMSGLRPKERFRQEAQAWLDFKKMTDKSVVQGYIWSEIFGKPRSKQPHPLYARYRRLSHVNKGK
ncbi:hypothetical protein CathTA2_1815 [Caldalkalibacillus thermarum TA2.A1]|uniref:Uncharacterized protein n=2 Tax=Caldalkalibacillus thermarum (strain TA2.A1) TaxID=986075 RepID=F5L7L5_CALTT|nr:hypothetical protein [Caldalkalibacillus thermarum]EGL82659.1 hypothetical protein CathTA2_1815 [Caldalkalibacillus thermarum TA2.A1]